MRVLELFTDNDTDIFINKNTIIPPNPPRGKQSDVQVKQFNEFWAEYPRKVGKKAAQDAWKKLKPDAALFDRIMQAVKSAKKTGTQKLKGSKDRARIPVQLCEHIVNICEEYIST